MTTGTRDRLRVFLRWMVRRDMAEVFAIERATFDYAWTADDFERCLRQRNCIGMVAEHGGRVAGYMLYELHPTTLHVLNLAVHPAHRRSWVGGQMVARLVHKLETHRREAITLAVRERNLGALSFFRWCGFRAVGLLRGHYEDSDEDAVAMEHRG